MRLFQHSGVLLLIKRQAFQKSGHVKPIKLSTTLLLFCWSVEIFSICIEQTSEAPHKGCSHSIGVKCGRADKRYMSQTAPMRNGIAATTFVNTVTLRLIVTDRADRGSIIDLPDKAMPFYPDSGICISNRLHEHIWHNSGGCQS